jgi:hypothetical protein
MSGEFCEECDHEFNVDSVECPCDCHDEDDD